MNRKIPFAFLASVFCHILLAICLHGHWYAPQRELVREIPVELLEPVKNSLEPRAPKSGKIELSSLAPRWRLATSENGDLPSNHTRGTLFEAPSSESIVKAANISAVQWVYRKTKLSLGYPAEFLSHDIEGTVEAKLEFNAAGKFELHSFRVLTDSPYLRVYVYRLLERVFAEEPIPEKLRKWQTKLNIVCFFQFERVEADMAVALHVTAPVVGNQLFFQEREVKPKLAWQLGPLHGYGPIPLGVDMLWFAKQAKDAYDHRPPPDDLAPYRQDPIFQNPS